MPFLLRMLLSLLFLTTAALAEPVAFPPDTTLIMIRHADRTGEQLNDRGIARAAALPAALQGVTIDKVFSPGFQRNLDTAAPLLQARGLSVTRIPAKNAAAQIVKDGAGLSVLWVGNKGNLTEIWADIGAPGAPPLNYGDLFFVQSDATGKITVTRKSWGN